MCGRVRIPLRAWIFSGLCSSSVTAALALMTVSTQLLLMDKINFHPTILGPSITSTFKGLTRIRPLSCGFDSSVGRALHWHRRGRGFESRTEPEFFQVSVLVVLRPHLYSYDIVAYARHFLPVRFFPKYYSNKLCFQRPQNVTWTEE